MTEVLTKLPATGMSRPGDLTGPAGHAGNHSSWMVRGHLRERAAC